MEKDNSDKEFLSNFQAELVNVVGGSNLNQELDLISLQRDLKGHEIRYEPEVWAGLYVRFEKNDPAILIFSSGKYNIAGAESVEKLKNANKNFLSILSNLGMDVKSTEIEIRNQVYLAKYRHELNLNTLSVGLGLENCEYEPEQFPGIFYSISDLEGTFLIFRTGKVVLTGVKTWKEAEKSFEKLFLNLNSMFRSS